MDIANAQKPSAIEYINIDKSEVTVEGDEIVQLINKKYNDKSDEEPPPPMSAQQGKATLEDTFRYCEEQFEEDIDASFMAKLKMLIRHAALKVQEANFFK